MEHDEANGVPPDKVAVVVEKLLNSTRPRRRVSVGKVGERVDSRPSAFCRTGCSKVRPRPASACSRATIPHGAELPHRAGSEDGGSLAEPVQRLNVGF